MFYTLKILLLTISLLFVLQIKFGADTLETKTMNWVRTSSLIKPIQSAADGVVAIISQVWDGDSAGAKKTFMKSISQGKEGVLESVDQGKKAVGENFTRVKEKLEALNLFDEEESESTK